MSQFLVLLVSVFSIVNPLAAIPVYVGLTAELPEADRKRLPRSTAFAAWVIMAVAYLAGEGLLAFFSISIASLRVAGGILVFGMAWSMLQARMAPQKHRPEETEEASRRPHMAVVPLAMPLLAGPGAISVMILAATRTDGMVQHGLAILAAGLVALSIWLILGLSGPIAAFLGTTGMNVATRFMGLILAALAVEFLAAGLSEIFPAWTVPVSTEGMGPG
ncbi:MAG TPA: NAAT family transporter [Longimicrobiales bacterium]|nr:NAAT family transporter [Longimicrobiales bacterium]